MILSNIKDEVARLRETARMLAKRGAPYVRSRGSILVSSGADGQAIVTSAECYSWDGTKRDLAKFVEEQLAKGAIEVAIEGGFDSSDDSKWLFDGEGDYLPWASSWSVVVYRAPTGWVDAPHGEAEYQ